MEKYVINGGKTLNGEIEISGMKNAALGIIYGCILIEGEVVLENLPMITDVKLCLDIIERMGASVTVEEGCKVRIDTTAIRGGTSCDELVKKMRASYYLVGAELGRFGASRVCFPGGCDFGSRPIDQHIKGFEALGAKVSTENEHITCSTEEPLKGANIFFDKITVGGTMNVMLAACRAEGTTVIENAAREPHIVDLANFLSACGAQISGAGTDSIKIRGTKNLHGCTYSIIPDMIEAGTYMIAAAATGGKLTLKNVIPKHLESLTAKLAEMGVSVTVGDGEDSVTVSCPPPASLSPITLKTRPYPGFPTDMQPQIAALLCLANGKGTIIEGVYDKRFRYAEELRRMGARIEIDGSTETILGPTVFEPAHVRAVDLRAGAAMVIAALATSGKTEIEDIHHIERGYVDIVGKLTALGADIRRVSVD